MFSVKCSSDIKHTLGSICFRQHLFCIKRHFQLRTACATRGRFNKKRITSTCFFQVLPHDFTSGNVWHSRDPKTCARVRIMRAGKTLLMTSYRLQKLGIFVNLQLYILYRCSYGICPLTIKILGSVHPQRLIQFPPSCAGRSPEILRNGGRVLHTSIPDDETACVSTGLCNMSPLTPNG